MIHFDGKLENSRFAWELCMFHKFRELSDGLSTVEFKINYDKYVGDHTPRFEIFFVLFNYVIVDFSVYNIYHADSEHYSRD